MSPERYNKEVVALREADPTNVLLPTLQRGHSAVNEAYLKKAWSLVRPIIAPPAPKGGDIVVKEATVLHSAKKTADEVLLRLFREKGHLDRQLRAVSNKLHSCTSDAERADVVDEILAGQKGIAKLNYTIRYYEQHQKLPHQPALPTENTEGYDGDIPTDPLKLVAAVEVARKSVNRYVSEVEKYPLAVLDDKKHPLRVRYEKSESNLKKWRLRHEALKQALIKAKEERKNG